MKKLLKFLFLLVVPAVVIVLLQFAYAYECGNNSCEEGETKCSCPTDCGSCAGNVQGEACREYICIDKSCVPLMKFPCCGNKICESTESFTKCGQDCPPRSVLIETPDFGDKEFSRGDELLIKVKVYAETVAATDTLVKAKGFFGEIQLGDSNEFNAGSLNDGIYANTVMVESNAKEGDNEIAIYANKVGVIDTKTFKVKVNPKLELSGEFNKESYDLGDIIAIKGVLKKKGIPLKQKMTLSFYSNESRFVYKEIESDENGSYNFEYHTSLLDPAGEWKILVESADEHLNYGKVEKNFLFGVSAGIAYYDVTFIEPSKKAFNRGEKIDFVARVVDKEGKPIDGATTVVQFPNKQVLTLREVTDGTYSGNMKIPLDFALGEQEIRATTSKNDNGTLKAGLGKTSVFVNKANIVNEIVSPSKNIFNLGEKLDFVIMPKYEDGSAVKNGTVDIKVDERQFRAKEAANGAYSFNVGSIEGKQNRMNVVVKTADQFGNDEETTMVLEVKQEYQPFYFFTKDTPTLAVTIIVLLAVFVAVAVFAKNSVAGKMREGRLNELKELRTKLQDEYFNQRSVKTDEYKRVLQQYDAEVDEIKASMAAAKTRKPFEFDIIGKIREKLGKGN